MNKKSLFALTVSVCLGVGSVAGAQESAGTAERGVGVGPFAKDAYPSSLVERPLTLPAGMIEVEAGLNHFSVSDDLTGGTVDGDSTGLGVGLQWGITDELEVGLFTGLSVDPDFEFSDAIDIEAAYLVVDTEMVDVAPRLGLPFRFEEEADLVPGITLGADTRFALAEQFAIIAGEDLLDIGFESEMSDLNINVGVIVQPIASLGIVARTQIASIELAGDMNDTTHWGDMIPLSLEAVFAATNKLDVTAGLAFPSLEDAGDMYSFLVGAALRL